jgi:Fe2+ or Zn2+ uptake regulation protein
MHTPSNLNSDRSHADAHPAIAIIEPLCAVFRRTLREQGLKYTAERARVLDVIVRFEGPFDGEELLASLRASAGMHRGAPRVSKATTYRTLRLLQAAGVIRRVIVQGTTKYELSQGLATGLAIVEEGSHSTQRVISAPEIEEACRDACARLGYKLVRWEAKLVVEG